MTPLKKLLTGTTSLSHYGGLVRDPITVGTLILGAGTAAAAGAFVTMAVGYIATTLVTSWAVSALTPKPNMSGIKGTLVNSREAAAPQEYVYGTVRKGGTITYMEATGAENKYLHMIIALAGHEVASIGDIYIDDQVATLDGSGFVTSQSWNSKIRIQKYTGSQTTAPSALLAASNQIDSSFVGNGIAYLYVRLEYDQDTFPNGVPLFTAIVNGKKVYDPRSASTGHSTNSALCVRDYIISDYGLGDAGVDETVFATAANVSDENVTLAVGGTEKRYTMNGVIRADQTPGAVLQDMMTSCAGMLFWGQGNWQLKPAYYTNPVKTFTLDDLRSPIQLQTRQSMSDIFNVVRGTFVDKAQGYIVVDYPEIVSAAYLAEDNNIETPVDLTLPFTTSAATAQRIGALTLNRGREQITLSADFGMSAFNVQVGDIVAMTNGRYGWSAKEFEVVGWNFFADGDAGDLRVRLTLRETSEAAFDWDADETAIISNNTALPVFNTVPAPSNLTLTATTVLNDDGISIPAIRANWTASTDSFVQYYEVQYKRLGGEEDYGSIATSQTESEDWGSITVSATDTEDYGLVNEPILTPDAEYSSVLGTSNTFTIQPVLNGYDYQIRVRAINSIGVRSPFVSSSIASAGDTTPPGTPSNLTSSPGLKYIELRWINPADQDFNYVEVWENTTNNLASASLIGVSSGSNFVRGNLANETTLYHWVRAVDYSLNKSPFTASVNSTTLLIAPADFNQAVNDLFSEAGAFGVEPVSSLPATGGFDGQLVLLLPEITIYRWDATTSSWSTDIYTASSVEAGSLTFASFAAGIEPVGVVNTLPTVAGYTGPQVVVLTTDGKLYRLVSGAWTTAISTDDIDGTLGANLFPSGLRPVEVVAALPTTDLYQGRIVLLTTDNKMYRYTGSAWTAAVPATDLTGQINGAQIADAAITATKIGAAAVAEAAIATGAITSTKLGAGSVLAEKIAAAAVTAEKIGNAAVTTAKLATAAVTADIIAASAITTAKINDDAITTAKIAANAVTTAEIADAAIAAGKIAANAVTSNEIAAGAVTATALAAAAVTAGKIAVGAVTESVIDAGAITTTKISNDAITTAKIAANAVTASQISAGSITTAKIAAGAVTAAEIAADSITSEKIAAGAVTASEIASETITASNISAAAITTAKIAAGAVTSTEISAGAVVAGKIAAGAVTATEIAAGSITTEKVAANAITANEISSSAITAGKIASGAITTSKIAAGAVTATEIASDTITSAQIAAGAITAAEISAGAVTTAKISAGAVTATEIAADAITTDKIAAGAVTAAEITAGSITTAKIAAGAVTASEIAAGAITTGKIAAGAVTAVEIAADTITASNIAAGAITASEIAANAVTAEKVIAGAISADKIAANAVVAEKIAANAVTAGKILAGAVETDKLAANSVVTGKIAAGAVNADQIAANAVVSAKIAAGSITADKIAADAVTADKILAGAIITSKIAAGAVTAATISTGAVTASKISVTDLSAISANLGTIQVGSANIADTIQSDNYVANTTGWRIRMDGSAEFNGPVISRQLEVATGTFTLPALIDDNNSNVLDKLSEYWIETTVASSAWTGAKETFMALVGREGSNGTVYATNTNITNQPQNIQWGWESDVVPITRWSGNQRLWIRVSLNTRLVDRLEGFVLRWRLIKVT